MNTERTETIKGYVFYDDDCGFCRSVVRWSHRAMFRWGYHFVPMRAEWALKILGVHTADELREMKLVVAGGKIFGGADAFGEIARNTLVLYPLHLLLKLPGMALMARKAYSIIAANRHRIAKPEPCGQDHAGYVKRVFLSVP